MSAKILIVDDERNIRRTLGMVLTGESYEVSEAGSLAEARAILREPVKPEVLLLDVQLGDGSGIDLLNEMKQDPALRRIPVVMISGHATIQDAVRATRLAAFDFMEKPLARDRVLIVVRNAVEHYQQQRELLRLRDEVESRFALLGSSSPMETLRAQIAKVAPTRSRVLIIGESGTGKELIARAIHRNSSCAEGAFVKVNCAAIAPTLIESELFGHEKGAFTGANARKRGLFEIASDGTIFLDEIGDMSLAAQAKVLRVLQTGDFTRVGGESVLNTNARVVAATNRDLEKMVAEGTFREDLFFRLNVFPLTSPPLRDRRDDIPLLTRAFVADCCAEHGLGLKDIAQVVIDRLCVYSWPGNVRELRNVVERMVILAEDVLNESDLPQEVLDNDNERVSTVRTLSGIETFDHLSLRDFREEMERQYILVRLRENNWNISKTAAVLSVERTNLHKKMKSLGIRREK